MNGGNESPKVRGWGVDHGLPRSQTDGKFTKFLLDLDKQKRSSASE